MSNASPKPKTNLTFQESIEQRLAEVEREKELLTTQNRDLARVNATLESANKEMARKTARLETEKKSLLSKKYKVRGGKSQPNNGRQDRRIPQNNKFTHDDKDNNNHNNNNIKRSGHSNKLRAWKPKPQIKVNRSHPSAFHDRRKFRGTHDDKHCIDDQKNNDSMPLLASKDTFPSLDSLIDAAESSKLPQPNVTNGAWANKIKLPTTTSDETTTLSTLSSLNRPSKGLSLLSKKSKKQNNTIDQQEKIDHSASTSDETTVSLNPTNDSKALSSATSPHEDAKTNDEQPKTDTPVLKSEDSIPSLNPSNDLEAVSSTQPSQQEDDKASDEQPTNDKSALKSEDANPSLNPSNDSEAVSFTHPSAKEDFKASDEQPTNAPPVFRSDKATLSLNPSNDTELSTNPSFDTTYSQQKQPVMVPFFVPVVYHRNYCLYPVPPPNGYQPQFPQYAPTVPLQQPPPHNYYGYNESQQQFFGGQQPVPDNPWSRDNSNGYASQRGHFDGSGYGQGNGEGYMPFSGNQWNHQHY